MKKLLVMIIYAIGLPLFAASVDESLEDLAKRLQKDRELERTANKVVPDELRNELIIYLRKVRDRKIYGNGTSAEILLVNLNDQEYVQQLLERYDSANVLEHERAAGVFGASSQVRVIPLMSEFIYQEEGFFFEPVHERIASSKSVRAGMVMLKVLSKSPDVSHEVQEWARPFLKKDIPWGKMDYRNLMQQWWEENERYFLSKEYDRLLPLGAVHPPEEPLVMLKKETVEKSQIEPEPPLVASDPETNSPSAAVGKPPVQLEILDEAEPLPKPFNPWKNIFPIVGILFAIAFIFFKSRKK